MIQDKECIIREFLMKDNENYNLTSLGFIQDFEKEISFLLELSQDLPMTTFSAWKHQLLNTYYAERQFPAFVQSNINVPLFIENIYSKAQNMVETKYWKESPAEVNTYIAAFKDSLAYLLPRDLFLKYYHYYFTTDLRLNTPEELYYYCQQITDTIFPLSSTEILEHVKNAHPVFCTGISKWLKNKTCPSGKTFTMKHTSRSSRPSKKTGWPPPNNRCPSEITPSGSSKTNSWNPIANGKHSC